MMIVGRSAALLLAACGALIATTAAAQSVIPPVLVGALPTVGGVTASVSLPPWIIVVDASGFVRGFDTSTTAAPTSTPYADVEASGWSFNITFPGPAALVAVSASRFAVVNATTFQVFSVNSVVVNGTLRPLTTFTIAPAKNLTFMTSNPIVTSSGTLVLATQRTDQNWASQIIGMIAATSPPRIAWEVDLPGTSTGPLTCGAGAVIAPVQWLNQVSVMEYAIFSIKEHSGEVWWNTTTANVVTEAYYAGQLHGHGSRMLFFTTYGQQFGTGALFSIAVEPSTSGTNATQVGGVQGQAIVAPFGFVDGSSNEPVVAYFFTYDNNNVVLLDGTTGDVLLAPTALANMSQCNGLSSVFQGPAANRFTVTTGPGGLVSGACLVVVHLVDPREPANPIAVAPVTTALPSQAVQAKGCTDDSGAVYVSGTGFTQRYVRPAPTAAYALSWQLNHGTVPHCIAAVAGAPAVVVVGSRVSFVLQSFGGDRHFAITSGGYFVVDHLSNRTAAVFNYGPASGLALNSSALTLWSQPATFYGLMFHPERPHSLYGFSNVVQIIDSVTGQVRRTSPTTISYGTFLSTSIDAARNRLYITTLQSWHEFDATSLALLRRVPFTSSQGFSTLVVDDAYDGDSYIVLFTANTLTVYRKRNGYNEVVWTLGLEQANQNFMLTNMQRDRFIVATASGVYAFGFVNATSLWQYLTSAAPTIYECPRNVDCTFVFANTLLLVIDNENGLPTWNMSVTSVTVVAPAYFPDGDRVAVLLVQQSTAAYSTMVLNVAAAAADPPSVVVWAAPYGSYFYYSVGVRSKRIVLSADGRVVFVPTLQPRNGVAALDAATGALKYILPVGGLTYLSQMDAVGAASGAGEAAGLLFAMNPSSSQPAMYFFPEPRI